MALQPDATRIVGKSTTGGDSVPVRVDDLGRIVQSGGNAGTPTTLAVDNTVKTVLAANNNRVGAYIQNNGLGVARITFGGTDPTAALGIRLQPGDDLPVGAFTGIIECIREGATNTTLDIQEFVI